MLLKISLVTVALLSVCFGQQSANLEVAGSDKQVRLEDIERDTLTSAHQRQQTSQPTNQQQTVQQQQAQQQYGLTQQQLAAYQQQLLLQQLQQQYFAPHPVAYPGYNAVPLMIIPGNHLGVGTPALPLQAYFLPDPIIYQQQPPAAAPQQAPVTSAATNNIYQVPTQRIQQTPRYQQQVVSNQVYRLPQQTQQPVHNFVYTSNPQQSVTSQQSQQLVLQPQTIQQPYNAYNAIYQQRPQKNLYSSGIKSTPAPPGLLKSASQAAPVTYSLQNGDQTSSSYINYKSF